MSKSIIKLEDYIWASVFRYPRLYSRNTYQESRMAVLKHLFLVIGNGIEYNPELNNFNNHEYTCLLPEIVDRLKAGEKIVQVIRGYETVEVCFYKDFIDSGRENLLNITMPQSFELRQKLLMAEIYPDSHYIYINFLNNSNCNDGAFDSPYPYSLEYTPMWDRQNRKLMDKELILSDWREGIVEIYTWARDWMKSDKFEKNNYFNWANKLDKDSLFLDNWKNKRSVEEFCINYGIEPKQYQNPLDAAKDIVAKNRKQRIDTAQLIIDTYI